MRFLHISWQKAIRMSKALAAKVKRSGFRPDILVMILRGGALPARVMSDELNNLNLRAMKIEFYEAPGKTARKPRITQRLGADVRGKRVLIIDDVADTGESLLAAKKSLRGAGEVRVACLHYKPHSTLKPDYFIGKTSAWIVYPWEVVETREKLKKK
ncbi:MAG: phosphoribosyltransferase [Candidatus Micrarchaeia archaeon]